MRRFLILSVAAFAGVAFTTAARAGIDCDGSSVAETSKPTVMADSGKSAQQTAIATPTESKGG